MTTETAPAPAPTTTEASPAAPATTSPPATTTEAPADAPSLLGAAAVTPEAAPPTVHVLSADDLRYEGIPETFKLDETLSTEFLKVATDANLPKEQAQALLKLHVTQMEAAQQAQLAAWNTTQSDWQNQIKADPEIGGARLPDVLSTCAKAIDEFGTPEVRKALDETGAGNHPAILKMIHKMAEALVKEGTPLVPPNNSRATPGKPSSLGAALYQEG